MKIDSLSSNNAVADVETIIANNAQLFLFSVVFLSFYFVNTKVGNLAICVRFINMLCLLPRLKQMVH